MKRQTLAVDAAVAVLVAALVLIISPGPAITVLIAGLAMIVCTASLVIDSTRRRRRRRAISRSK
jgi:FtsH-binding integral membrane protein